MHKPRSDGRSFELRAVLAPALLLLCVLLTLAGCGSGDGGSDATSPRDSESSAGGDGGRSEMVERVRRSIVAVTAFPRGENRDPSSGARHSHGTGVILAGDKGLVLTSNHFVENAGGLQVWVGGREILARPVARAQCNDLAIVRLRSRPPGLVPLPFGDSAALSPGEEVTAVGYLRPPGSPEPTFVATRGEVSAVDVRQRITPDLPPFPSLLLHQAPLQLAMSGGPLVDEQGRLVGINTVIDAESDGLQEAIAGRQVRRLLDKLRGGEAAAFEGWESEHRCHAAIARLTGSYFKAHATH